MFERYTEPARRAIFFARYEASQSGSRTIETHHLLLGTFREDLNLAASCLKPPDSIERLREQIESRQPAKEKVYINIDLPLTNPCKRILAYANEEAERLGHSYIGTEHLLLGILLEERCLAQELLLERGLRLETIREELARGMADAQSRSFTLFFTGHPIDLALAKHNFTVPRQHLGQALAAKAQGVAGEAQRELLLFIETLALEVAQGTSVKDVLLTIRGFRSGLPDEEDWKYRFQLTMLLAEVLLARYERRTKT